MSNQTIAATFALMGSIAVLLGMRYLWAGPRRPVRTRATHPPKIASLEPLQPVPVERDSDGWWTHPGVPDFGEDVNAFMAWLSAQGLVTAYVSLEGEDLDHPTYVSYYDQGSASVAGWNPVPPAGEGWFTLSIHDTDDGPHWVWARRADVAADHALALAINAECYCEPLQGGQRFSRTTFKDNGYPILLDADGKRSVFCDLNDDLEDAA